MKKDKAILVVSYGSSYRMEREKSIGGIEAAIAAVFPEYRVYRAFTSDTIIDRIWRKEGMRIDSIKEALERAASDGIQKMVILQTHLVKGIRYESLENAVNQYKESFESIRVLEPMLSLDPYIEAFADGLEMLGERYDDGKTALCFVGHGIDEAFSAAYAAIQDRLDARGKTHFYIGTLSMKPSCQELVERIRTKGIEQRVVIFPLMLVSGYHVRKDLAGPGENSWINVFSREGFEVECVKKGLGEEAFIQNVFVEYLKNVIL